MTIFAMVFPGQGSQTVGMLADIAIDYSIVYTTFAEASNVLGYDLWERTQLGPTEDLNKTWITQPALLASSVAIWRIWKMYSKYKPVFLAGHSLGEYSALVCSGSLDFSTAITLVALRGKLMQEAVPDGTGTMSAIIGINKNIIVTICKQVAQGQVVSAVNFNSPDQVVIAGHKEAVERASLACKEAGAKLILPLSVTVPSHCALMKPAAEKLAKVLEKIILNEPQIPILNNVDVRIEREPTAIRAALVRQLYYPVRWTEIIEYLSVQGVKILLEIGPGQVLTKLTKRTVNNISAIAVNHPSTLSIALKCFSRGTI